MLIFHNILLKSDSKPLQFFWCQPKWFGGIGWSIEPSVGHWTNSEINFHIVLELLTASYTLDIYCANMLNTMILLKIDNTSALAWINKESASTGTEIRISKHIWDLCAARNSQLQKWNKIADSEPRNENGNFKRAPKDQIFKLATKKMLRPKTNLFTSRGNNKMKIFFFMLQRSFGFKFSFDWWQEILYAFSPLT